MSNDIKTIIFDFDGVIVQSNRLKYEAFFELFQPMIAPTIHRILRRHREKTRHAILELILLESGIIDRDEKSTLSEIINNYAEKYNQIVETDTIACPEVPGAQEALRLLYKSYPLYLNSTTPLKPLHKIMRERGLIGYFQKIFGGPEPKIENLKLILKRENIPGTEALIVGDGISDLEAAQHFGCHFVGVRNEFNNYDKDHHHIETLEELPDLVSEMVCRDI